MDRRLLQRHRRNPILAADDLPYRAHTVFNPAAARVGYDVVLLLRVEGFRGHSHFTTARSADGVTGWRIDEKPSLSPDPALFPEDEWGIEDPRAVFLPEIGRYGVTFTSYSPRGPLVSLALTTDFTSFERRGPVMPPDDKDAALFPRRFGGEWLMVHRPVRAGAPADIEISRSPDLAAWSSSAVLLPARAGGWWDAGKVGLGPPPLETPEGWLLMYHGVRHTCSGALYRSGLALLDLDDPTRVIARTDDWVFGPEEPYERTGDVPNVVFPSGWVKTPDEEGVMVYYGAADTSVCLATAKIADLLDAVREK
jgi:predicted GH43/DUF377 family glycosyl hydrolase